MGIKTENKGLVTIIPSPLGMSLREVYVEGQQHTSGEPPQMS